MRFKKEKSRAIKAKKIILIDGHSLIYRAFYALPTTLATSSGQITNAVYGFTSMLIKLIRENKPDFIAVAFDKGPVTFRHEIFNDYKAHRPETPDELRAQFPLVKNVLEALEIPAFELEGYEADDILGTLVKEAEKEKSEVLVVTGDKDALQLISPQVKIMTTRKGISDIIIYDQDKLREKYGLEPEKIKDLLALKGDPSDNIPGVPGIGEKTAVKLIKEFGSLEKVLENVSQIRGEKLRKSLKDYAEQARLSKELATLERDLPLEVDFDEFPVGEWNWKEVKEVFSTLEFNTLLKRMEELGYKPKKPGKSSLSLSDLGVKARLVENQDALDELVEALSSKTKGEGKEDGEIALELEVEDHNSNGKLQGLAFCFGERNTAYYLCLNSSPLGKPKEEIELFLEKLKSFLESPSLKKVVHNGKAKILSLQREGIKLSGLSFDTQIAAYLLQPSKGKYPLSDLVREYLHLDFEEEERAEGKERREGRQERSLQRAVLCLKLKKVLEERLEEEGSLDLFNNIEMPLVSVLAKMEQVGMGIDLSKLEELSLGLEKWLSQLEGKVFSYAGEEFNLNSPQQLGAILFDKLGLKSQKKTKTGYSTDSSVLYKLINQHPVIEDIINYRELSKLKSTYVEALPRLISSQTGRLHTSFNQVGTATGRLSSSNPNLQNIPIRTPMGSRIREAFVPARNSDELLVADYSQIELRVLAHLSSDENLVRAFEEGRDIHQATAAEVFDVEQDKVNSQMRRAAKAVNFGIVYGISPHGLSEQLGISKTEAKKYIDKYFSRYHQVKKFIEETVAKAYAQGFVTTLLGRKRFLPELKSSNLRIRNFGERLAINTTIQGSAADLMKLAMINLDKKFEEEGFQSRMVLQVHDELIFEVPLLEKGFLAEVIKEIMENVYLLRPKLIVNISWGKNWLEAK